MTFGRAQRTYSIPFPGEIKPKVKITNLPSTPNLSLQKFVSTNGISGMPCGTKHIFSSST